ncbi:MAG: hypothetical protein KBA75_01920 [Alphaproteobacteria bacterium]|nr:hypothetical protein [Alphaproteobacteria bacterium]
MALAANIMMANETASEPRRDWLLKVVNRLTRRQLDLVEAPPQSVVRQAVDARLAIEVSGDWEAIQAICGYGQYEFALAQANLPLTAATIQHFCRNHRDCDASLAGQFEVLNGDVPEALAVFYSIYHTQTRLDAEAALFLAQSSGTTRVARSMADLLTIGGFQHGDKSINCQGRVYAVAAAFDTAVVIDAANQEALARLTLSADDPEHLLQLSPDSVGLLAARLAETYRLTPLAFFRKANLLAEARQDVNRFTTHERFAVALYEGDLPISEPWVARLIAAMRDIVPGLVGNLPKRMNDVAQISA